MAGTNGLSFGAWRGTNAGAWQGRTALDRGLKCHGSPGESEALPGNRFLVPSRRAGRVWVNNYHAYPAHAAFGGYKQSGIGRETHKMMLDHYQQTKNLLVSYSPRKLGFF